MEKNIDVNEKKEILDKFLEFQQNILENNSEILLVYEEFKNIVNKFEKRHKCKVDVENLPIQEFNKKSTEELTNTIDNLLENSTVENYADFSNYLDTYLDFMISDINLTISCMKTNMSQPLIEYQYAQLVTFINENKIILNNMEQIIKNIEKLK